MLEIQEPVNVWALFKQNTIHPYSFSWQGRQIKVDSVNLVHATKTGSSVYYYFSVSSEGNFYRLKFDLHKLKWFLEAVDAD